MRHGRLAVGLGIVLVALCVSTAMPAAARTLVVAQAPDASSPTSIHAFQRNGITANEVATDVRIRRNLVTGLGPTTGAVQNGIQVARGATGVVEDNEVTETISASCTTANCPANASNILLGSGSVLNAPVPGPVAP